MGNKWEWNINYVREKCLLIIHNYILTLRPPLLSHASLVEHLLIRLKSSVISSWRLIPFSGEYTNNWCRFRLLFITVSISIGDSPSSLGWAAVLMSWVQLSVFLAWLLPLFEGPVIFLSLGSGCSFEISRTEHYIRLWFWRKISVFYLHDSIHCSRN